LTVVYVHSSLLFSGFFFVSFVQVIPFITNMRWVSSLIWCCTTSAVAQSTEGLYNLVERRLPKHVDQFQFSINSNLTHNGGYDQFTVKTAHNGTVLVEGSSISALSSG
jgi:alpha-N-acetylglucosaminidase